MTERLPFKGYASGFVHFLAPRIKDCNEHAPRGLSLLKPHPPGDPRGKGRNFSVRLGRLSPTAPRKVPRP